MSGKDINAWRRFYAKTAVLPTGCIVWIGSINNFGYGQFGHNGRLVMAHRWSYEDNVGPIPDGLELDHLCRVPSCVNPDHLEPVTHAENITRAIRAKGQTHCKRGHDLAIHARITKAGSRDCRACERERAAIKREQVKAGRVSVQIHGGTE